MTLGIRLEELLPPIFDELVKSAFGEPLGQEERDAIVSSITRTLAWSRLKGPKRSSEPRITNFPHVVFTDDGFATGLFDKNSIIAYMNDSTGLGRDFCSLAIELMEAELALLVFNADGEAVVIEDVGSFKLISDDIHSLKHNKYKKIIITETITKLQHAMNELREGKTAEFFVAEARKFVRSFAAGLRSSLLRIKKSDSDDTKTDLPIRYRVDLSPKLFPNRSDSRIKRVDVLGS